MLRPMRPKPLMPTLIAIALPPNGKTLPRGRLPSYPVKHPGSIFLARPGQLPPVVLSEALRLRSGQAKDLNRSQWLRLRFLDSALPFHCPGGTGLWPVGAQDTGETPVPPMAQRAGLRSE